MADFLTAYAKVKDFEGGWCTVVGDAGGETYAGIARNFFSSWSGWKLVDAAKVHSSYRQGATAFSRHLASVPGLSDLVTQWYRTEWWNRMGLDRFPQSVADEIFEQSVNLGRGGAGRYLQRLCNALNFRRGQNIFTDLKEDGVVGPKTLAALAAILDGRSDAHQVVHALNCLQGAHYIGLAARSFTHRKFMDGWMKRTHAE